MTSDFNLDPNQIDELNKCKPVLIPESNDRVRIVFNPFDFNNYVIFSCSLCHGTSKSLKGISAHYQQQRCYYSWKYGLLKKHAVQMGIESPQVTIAASSHDVKVTKWPPQPTFWEKLELHDVDNSVVCHRTTFIFSVSSKTFTNVRNNLRYSKTQLENSCKRL